MTKLILTRSESKRFWSKVNKDGPVHPYDPKLSKCWLWTACRDKNGYGAFGLVTRGRLPTQRIRKSWLAHRICYFIRVGFPEKPELRHSCDNPSCVNPLHLIPSTHGENMQDMAIKKRHWTHHRPVKNKGERVQWAKLTDELVRRMREFHAKTKSLFAVQKEFGLESLSTGTVGSAIYRKTWKHVE